jgi:hypothetical protein
MSMPTIIPMPGTTQDPIFNPYEDDEEDDE